MTTPLEQLFSRLPRRAPQATYRLQLNADFPLDAAAEVSAYIAELGASDAYASPILTARVGSPHGYDITDHSQISPDIGGEEAFDRWSAALRQHGLGLILDVVPNHMGIGDLRNNWWLDLLENGPSSIYAHYFDVEWDPVPSQLHNKVLLPVLGNQYGDVLEAGELQLNYNDGAFFLTYWENTFPVNPRSYRMILEYRLEALLEQLGADDLDVAELQSIITALSYLPPRTETAPDKIQERNREKEVIKRRINNLYQQSEPFRQAIAETLAYFNGTPGDMRSFDALDALLGEQPYRLAFWRVAAEEINYRRFFDINELAAIRVELPDVLQATHQLVFRLIASGQANGLRIDHPDGLWNPPSYFRQLQENFLAYWAAANLPGNEEAVPDSLAPEVSTWIEQELAEPAPAGPLLRWPLYVIAEKILTDGETLPEDWAVEGTTGYDFLNELNNIFVDQRNRKALDRLYSDVAGPRPNFANLVNSKKKEIMLVSLASEINTLSHMLDRLTESNRRFRDFTLNSLTFAIREVIASLPVYRTYISGPGTVTPWDERYVEAAIRDAQRRNPRTAGLIFNFLRDTLLLRNLESFDEEARDEVVRFVMKFQQISGPVMAKGVEDTTFYVYNRLISLNEVGGHPEHFGGSVAELHRHASTRARRWPHSMLSSSTHDTKRSEDVRARINVLSEIPAEWRQMVNRWSRLNARKRSEVDGQLMPSRNDEYLLYQTLVGAWPDQWEEDAGRRDAEKREAAATESKPYLTAPSLPQFKERIVRYMEKATREAKVYTSWVNPNAAYDEAVRKFVEGILEPRRSTRFLDSLNTFAGRVAYFGRFNSLAQTLVKITAPGVPDIYQGTELWDLSLVDPDNRRPVDFSLRREVLADLKQRMAAGEQAALANELLAQAHDGRIKLYMLHSTLMLRRENPELFAGADYLPLNAIGEQAEHVVAYARRSAAGEVLIVVPRLSLTLARGEVTPPTGDLWEDTWLALPDAPIGAAYRERFTGHELHVGEHEGTPGLWMSDVLAHFPVALLEAVKR
ncbi:malto-oligosyltrehalose synthase [Candidatus Viridilinea mediisalina]|uniref:Malto-oligosyltrehalose synthase n=1 Tax=Candidatus Viridilinea mediisalina TaxID=2024553 RepID=A0A2A6REK5_9CHLR|nr:malto-oligosyltrehalose synthase [Candidatus Viridilinea mediisalina]PDW01424.1 malto-oligosyltrehalose synthase [Candidatus Viridilinea mediisalina]